MEMAASNEHEYFERDVDDLFGQGLTADRANTEAQLLKTYLTDATPHEIIQSLVYFLQKNENAQCDRLLDFQEFLTKHSLTHISKWSSVFVGLQLSTTRIDVILACERIKQNINCVPTENEHLRKNNVSEHNLEICKNIEEMENGIQQIREMREQLERDTLQTRQDTLQTRQDTLQTHAEIKEIIKQMNENSKKYTEWLNSYTLILCLKGFAISCVISGAISVVDYACTNFAQKVWEHIRRVRRNPNWSCGRKLYAPDMA